MILMIARVLPPRPPSRPLSTRRRASCCLIFLSLSLRLSPTQPALSSSSSSPMLQRVQLLIVNFDISYLLEFYPRRLCELAKLAVPLRRSRYVYAAAAAAAILRSTWPLSACDDDDDVQLSSVCNRFVLLRVTLTGSVFPRFESPLHTNICFPSLHPHLSLRTRPLATTLSFTATVNRLVAAAFSPSPLHPSSLVALLCVEQGIVRNFVARVELYD